MFIVFMLTLSIVQRCEDALLKCYQLLIATVNLNHRDSENRPTVVSKDKRPKTVTKIKRNQVRLQVQVGTEMANEMKRSRNDMSFLFNTTCSVGITTLENSKDTVESFNLASGFFFLSPQSPPRSCVESVSSFSGPRTPQSSLQRLNGPCMLVVVKSKRR